MDEPLQIAEVVRQACLEAALHAYEDAGLSGLCIESYTGAHQVLDMQETYDDGETSVQTTIVDQYNINMEVDDRPVRRDGHWQVYAVLIAGVSVVNTWRRKRR
jgi:hypothetical protein